MILNLKCLGYAQTLYQFLPLQGRLCRQNYSLPILLCQGQGMGQIDTSGLSFIVDSLEDVF